MSIYSRILVGFLFVILVSSCTEKQPLSEVEVFTPVSADPGETETPLPPTETATETEVPTKTEMPTVTVTPEPTKNLEEERKQEVVKRVNEFIGSEGEFSDEELRKSPNWFSLSADKNEPLPLGAINNFAVQTVLVDYLETKDKLMLFLGTADTSGNRTVVVYPMFKEMFISYMVRKSGMPRFSGGDAEALATKNLDESRVFLGENKGKPISLMLLDVAFPPFTEDSLDSLESQGYDREIVVENTDLINADLEYYRDLLAMVKKVDKGMKISSEQLPQKSGSDVFFFSQKKLMKLEDFVELSELPGKGFYSMTIRRP